MKYIDYKDVKTLKYFINGFKKIKARYYTGVCLRHQKALSQAIKRSREVALVPFVNQ
ncbi:MAG: 30S ribosomal protein S18, partial [Chloroflexi bacterium]|nr:30S ribosomal protein S18 [Chloroflexota bacterium]